MPCFGFLSKDDALDLQKAFVPSNTKRSTGWAVKVFLDWKKERGDSGEDECPADLLEQDDHGDLVKWLSRVLFAAEARTGKGSHYSPSTLSQLLAGVLRHMRSINPDSPNFLDQKDCRLSLFHKLRTMSIGADVKHAEIFNKEEEQQLWDSGTLGLHSPQALLNAVFYLNGESFCLCSPQC